MTIAAQHVRAAINHLRSTDPRWREIIRQVGPFSLRLERFPAHWLTTHLHHHSLQKLLEHSPAPAGASPPTAHPNEPLSDAQRRFRSELLAAIDRGLIDLSPPPSTQAAVARVQPLAELLQRYDSCLLPHFRFCCWGDLDQWPTADPLLPQCLNQLWSPADTPPSLPQALPPIPASTSGTWPIDTWAPFRSIAAWYLARWGQLAATKTRSTPQSPTTARTPADSQAMDQSPEH